MSKSFFLIFVMMTSVSVIGCSTFQTIKDGIGLDKSQDMQAEKSLLNYAAAAAYSDFKIIRDCLQQHSAKAPQKVKGKYEVSNGKFRLIEIFSLDESEGSGRLDLCTAVLIGKEKFNFSKGMEYNSKFLTRTFIFNFTGSILPRTDGVAISEAYQYSKAFKE